MTSREQRCSSCGEPVGIAFGGSICAACFLEQAITGAEIPEEAPGSSASDSPRRFGSYQLLEEIGRGGMGVIYRARRPGLERFIALKMPITGEFARLCHPNIVGIFGVGEREGRSHFAMEHITGQFLRESPSAAPFDRPNR